MNLTARPNLMTAAQRRPQRAGRGLTLIEMVLAIAGTALVSAAITAMTAAVSRGTAQSTDLRSLVVRQKTVTSRLTAAIRSSAKVLGAGDDVLVLWVNDDNGNGVPNLSELQRIARDTATDELCSFAAASLAPASDSTFDLATTDFDAVTAALAGSADFPREVWSAGIDALAIAVNHADVQQASLVSCRLTIATGGSRDIAITAAALRNR